MKTLPFRAARRPARASCIVALTLFAAPATAQTSVTWAAAYAQPSTDALAGVVRDAQGRSFVATVWQP